MNSYSDQNAWHSSLQDFPLPDRALAWKDLMSRLGLPVNDVPSVEDFQGSVSFHESPLGMEFALVSASAHQISGKYLEQSEAIWLVVIIQGKAQLHSETGFEDLHPGDIAYGPCRAEETMRFNESFQMLHIRIPRLTLSARVLSPSSMKIGSLHAKSGLAYVFSELLCATAKTLDEMTSADLRPVELAVTELLISCLGEEKAAFGLGGIAGAKASHLHSICQAVETMLSEPDINLKSVASDHGVSTRYLQKLFTAAGTTFSHYLRNRRLERSKADLVSPLHNQLSISEICFRWGFNGSAHFSRVFRNKYGVSPREYKRLHSQQYVAESISISEQRGGPGSF